MTSFRRQTVCLAVVLTWSFCSWSTTDPDLIFRTSIQVSSELLEWGDSILVTITTENVGVDSLDVLFPCPSYVLEPGDDAFWPPRIACPAYPGPVLRLHPGEQVVSEGWLPSGYLGVGHYELRATAQSVGFRVDESALVYMAGRAPLSHLTIAWSGQALGAVLRCAPTSSMLEPKRRRRPMRGRPPLMLKVLDSTFD